MTITIAETDEEIAACFDTMSQLRQHLDQAKFVETVRELESDGFRLAYIEDNNQIVCVAGYRVYSNLCLGKHLYVDDLVTSEDSRSKS